MADNTTIQARKQRYEILYQAYHEPIERYLLTRVRNQELAADLCQDTFERLWKFLVSQPSLQPVEAYKSWLYKVAGNLAIDQFRHDKQKAFQPLPEDEAYAQLPALMVEFDLDAMVVLQEAAEQLSPQYRECWIAVHHLGLTETQAAAALGISAKTVSANVSRARLQLSKKYFSLYGGLEQAELLHASDAIYTLIRGVHGSISMRKINEYEAKARDWRFRQYMKKHTDELRSSLIAPYYDPELAGIGGSHSNNGIWVPGGYYQQNPEDLAPVDLDNLR